MLDIRLHLPGDGRNGMGLQVGLGWWFLPVTLVVVFGTCAVYVGGICGIARGVSG